MNLDQPSKPQIAKADTAERMAALLERLSKTPAIPWMYRTEAEKLVKEWRNA